VSESDYVTVPVAAEPAASYVPPDELPALLKTLERQMKDAAKRLDFEAAAQLRDRIEALKESALAT
jgi:excinuclease ABC subunit B